MPLFPGASDVIYLAPRSERVGTVGDVKHAFQVRPLSSVVVLIVSVCSTTPVVFSLAFKTSTIVVCQ
jgi:hypothetical protein